MIPQLEGYPNYIAEENINQLQTRNHVLGKLPIYSSISEPTSNHEEILASKRYRSLIDEYCRAAGIDRDQVNPMMIMMTIGAMGGRIMTAEYPHKTTLIRIAEEIVRSEYNLDKSEVLFDLEIIDAPNMPAPEGSNTTNTFELDEVFSDEIEAELVKRRIMNALMQGAAKKGHFMFHLAGEQLNNLIPGITSLYQQTLLMNDLLYYFLGDKTFNSSFIDQDIVSSYVKINFDGDIPVIEAKAFSFPILVHEMVKGIIELFATQGQPEDEKVAKFVLDTCDLMKAEMWGCRLGPELWVAFHELIDIDHYHIKKLIILDVFKKDAEEFNTFFYNVLNNKDKARKEIKFIASTHLNRIMDYNFESDL